MLQFCSAYTWSTTGYQWLSWGSVLSNIAVFTSQVMKLVYFMITSYVTCDFVIWQEQRTSLKFYINLGKSATETLSTLQLKVAKQWVVHNVLDDTGASKEEEYPWKIMSDLKDLTCVPHPLLSDPRVRPSIEKFCDIFEAFEGRHLAKATGFLESEELNFSLSFPHPWVSNEKQNGIAFALHLHSPCL